METYKNGDRCPCCGQPISDRSDEWLELFSKFTHSLGLEKDAQEEIVLEPIDFRPPPDAGIYPPIQPKK